MNVRGWVVQEMCRAFDEWRSFQRILFFVFLFNGRFTCPIVCGHKISSSAIECKSRFKSVSSLWGKARSDEDCYPLFPPSSVVDTLPSPGNSLLYAILSIRYSGGGLRNKSKVETWFEWLSKLMDRRFFSGNTITAKEEELCLFLSFQWDSRSFSL